MDYERKKEIGTKVGEWIIQLLEGEVDEHLYLTDDGDIRALEDNMKFFVDQNGGDYEGGAHALAQRILYYWGYFEEIFGKEITAKLEKTKNEWYDTLISWTDVDDDTIHDDFREVVWHALNAVYPFLVDEDLISPIYLEEWEDEFDSSNEDDEEEV